MMLRVPQSSRPRWWYDFHGKQHAASIILDLCIRLGSSAFSWACKSFSSLLRLPEDRRQLFRNGLIASSRKRYSENEHAPSLSHHSFPSVLGHRMHLAMALYPELTNMLLVVVIMQTENAPADLFPSEKKSKERHLGWREIGQWKSTQRADV